MQIFKYFSFLRLSSVSCLFTPNAQLRLGAHARVGPKLVVFLHPSAESGRLSSDPLSLEFRSLVLLFMHGDHFINDCVYGSIDFIIDMSCECIFRYLCCVCY